jgi:hypothetical protein
MKTVKLYNGAVFVEFDPDKHYYRVIGSDAKPDGVTTILGLVPKYLLPWVARVTADHIHNGILARLAGEGAVEATFLASLCDEAKKEHTRKKEAAGNIGTIVHAFAEEIISQGDEWQTILKDLYEATPIEAQPGCVAFLNWWRSVGKLEQVESERIVFSRRLFYCGTCDLFAHIDGRPTVIDFKTGSGFYEDQPLQLAAYAMAIEEETGAEIKDGWIIHLDKESGKCTPYFVEITPELKKDWEAVRVAWRAVKRNQERHKQIRKESKWKAPQSTSITEPAAAL